MSAEKAKRTLLGIEIPRDVLAIRIAQPCLGVTVATDKDPTEALDEFNLLGGPVLMGEGFRRAADAAVAYFHERINDARQPS